ncbi:hypothetical protein Q668_02515 [Alcanivorax sp. PN-3]|nr:hypothetical protein Q668_02515 [Alcanivorax sp. PN-3]
MSSTPELPPVLAGPILRRLEERRLVLWLVASHDLDLHLHLFETDPQGAQPDRQWPLNADNCRRLPVGAAAVLHLIDLPLTSSLPEGREVGYDLIVHDHGAVADWAPHLLHAGQRRPSLVWRPRLTNLLHGSCRKPHQPGPDGLARADQVVADSLGDPETRPNLLLLTGDQIYADDVAMPMLATVHALIERLGLIDETLEGARVGDSQALYQHHDGFHRQRLLPAVESGRALRKRFFGGVRKPIFTTASADRHLVTFAEVIAMYLLAWSPTPWHLAEPRPPLLDATDQEQYQREARALATFREQMPAVARALAHLPTLMIFDDHDVTDDWNLTADWELTAYGQPFSRRIIGNALIAYLLCQGWGNAPDRVAPLIDDAAALLGDGTGALVMASQDALITRLLRFDGWHYQWPGTPKLIVLDTRTRRWRSERRPTRPSGLLDWEALSELQQALLGEEAVVVVSPAPMFGVKLIETVQRLFTLIGKPLMVDAENWMAHPGAARVLLNIFRHSRTPANYVILSGDVHYSFVYRIRIRHRDGGPRIWQITDSGLRNRFPERLLEWFDRLNRWLYAPWSPLNAFTKRRRLAVTPYRPDPHEAGRRLLNRAGIGRVWLDADGAPARIRHLGADGRDAEFEPDD